MRILTNKFSHLVINFYQNYNWCWNYLPSISGRQRTQKADDVCTHLNASIKRNESFFFNFWMRMMCAEADDMCAHMLTPPKSRKQWPTCEVQHYYQLVIVFSWKFYNRLSVQSVGTLSITFWLLIRCILKLFHLFTIVIKIPRYIIINFLDVLVFIFIK